MKYSLDTAIERAKLPISVQYSHNDVRGYWTIEDNYCQWIDSFDCCEITGKYIALRTRLLNQSREGKTRLP